MAFNATLSHKIRKVFIRGLEKGELSASEPDKTRIYVIRACK